MPNLDSLLRVQSQIVRCRLCPRLTAYREGVASERIRRFRDQVYWGKPVPSFGDPAARLLLIGLAPAAHGGNRTGRIFTGDRSGDFLFAALHRAGFANQPFSVHQGDGLALQNCYVTAAVRCAPPENKPAVEEFTACRPYLVHELQQLANVHVVLALGAVAFTAFLSAWSDAGRPLPLQRPRFQHGGATELPGGVCLLASYHPSQRNTQTGLITAAMLDAILVEAKQILARATLRSFP